MRRDCSDGMSRAEVPLTRNAKMNKPTLVSANCVYKTMATSEDESPHTAAVLGLRL